MNHYRAQVEEAHWGTRQSVVAVWYIRTGLCAADVMTRKLPGIRRVLQVQSITPGEWYQARARGEQTVTLEG